MTAPNGPSQQACIAGSMREAEHLQNGARWEAAATSAAPCRQATGQATSIWLSVMAQAEFSVSFAS